MNPYNIQNTNICNGIFHILFFKALLINEGETTRGERELGQSDPGRTGRKYKRANTDLQNIHIKLKIEKHQPHYPVRPGSLCPNSLSPRVVSPSFINSALKNKIWKTPLVSSISSYDMY
jgi:hypothetical protein